MATAKCTSGPRTTKGKRDSLTPLGWVWGFCLFYSKKHPSFLSLPYSCIRQALPVHLTMGGLRYV